MKELLRLEDLRLHFRTVAGAVRAVDGVSLAVERGEALVVAGESGCGKSSLARAVLRLLPRNVQSYSGRVLLDGLDVMKLPEERFREEVRWTRLALVPQAAMSSLNPVMRVADQVAEPLLVHRRAASPAEARRLAREAVRRVGVPADFLDRYPFELSGGMRQRLALAAALAVRPDVLILDEPTSALDVLTQAGIMNVLKTIRREAGTSFVLITHDIGAASEIAARVAVMYAGQVVETAGARGFFAEPLHPYSRALLASVPTLRGAGSPAPIPGRPPSLVDAPRGCRFADRCRARFSRCEEEPPEFRAADRTVRCWLYEGREAGRG